MNKYKAPYAIFLIIAGTMIMLTTMAGSHGHFNLENQWIRNALIIFLIFIISGIVNIVDLVKNKRSRALTGINAALNFIGFATLLQILIYVIDFNKNQGSLPMLFTTLIGILLLGNINLIRVDLMELLNHKENQVSE